MLRSTGTDSSTSFDGCLVEDGMEGGGTEDMGEKTEGRNDVGAVFISNPNGILWGTAWIPDLDQLSFNSP